MANPMDVSDWIIEEPGDCQGCHQFSNDLRLVPDLEAEDDNAPDLLLCRQCRCDQADRLLSDPEVTRSLGGGVAAIQLVEL